MNHLSRISICLLLIFIFANIPVSTPELLAAPAARQQEKKSQSSSKKKKTATSKSNASKTPANQSGNNTNAAQEGAQGKAVSNQHKNSLRQFEGQLMYVTNEYANNTAKVLSLGTTFNGSRTVFITVKGNEIDFYDATMHSHQLIKPSQKKVIHYSDITKEGVIVTGDFYDQIYTTFKDDGNITVGNKTYKRNIQTTPTGQTVSYKGDNCNVVNGLMTQYEIGDSPMMEMKAELWAVPQLKVSEVMKYPYYGFDTGSVVKKGIVNIQARIPFVGSMKMQNAFELIGINERPVSSSEMEPPADVVLTIANNNTALYKYNKAHDKALKKAGLKPENKKAKEVKKAISEEWDFAMEWDAYNIKPPKNDFTVWQFAESIVSDNHPSAKIWQDNGNPSPLVFEQRVEAADKDNAYYIPVLLGQLYSIKNDMLQKADEANKRSNTGNVNPGRVSKVDPYTIDLMKVNQMDKTALRNANLSTAEDVQKRIDFIEKYAAKNKTEYIPKEIYDEYVKKETQAFNEGLEKRKEERKEKRDKNNKKYYDEYVRQLKFHASLYTDRDFDWIRKTQRTMKELREESPNIKKSPWESWDGIHDPS